MKTNLISQNPSDTEEIGKAFDIIANEALTVDDVIKVILPIYQKYFTINEIQELNKFYSTDAMQDMRKKLPLISQDVAPAQVGLMNDYMGRVTKRLEEAFPPAHQVEQPTTSPTPHEKK